MIDMKKNYGIHKNLDTLDRVADLQVIKICLFKLPQIYIYILNRVY